MITISRQPITAGGGGSASAIVYDQPQGLTDVERIQAQQNAGFTLNEDGELEVITVNGPKRLLLNDPPA